MVCVRLKHQAIVAAVAELVLSLPPQVALAVGPQADAAAGPAGIAEVASFEDKLAEECFNDAEQNEGFHEAFAVLDKEGTWQSQGMACTLQFPWIPLRLQLGVLHVQLAVLWALTAVTPSPTMSTATNAGPLAAAMVLARP